MIHESSQDPNEATKQLAIAVGALTIALIDKGIISRPEYDHAAAQATAIIDQEFAQKRDQACLKCGDIQPGEDNK